MLTMYVLEGVKVIYFIVLYYVSSVNVIACVHTCALL